MSTARRRLSILAALTCALLAGASHAGAIDAPREIGPASVILEWSNFVSYNPRPDRLILDDGEGGWWLGASSPDSGARVLRLDGSLRARPGFGQRGRALSRDFGIYAWPSHLLADGDGGVYALWENGVAAQTLRLQPDGEFVPGWGDTDLNWTFTPGHNSEFPTAVRVGEQGILIAVKRTPFEPPRVKRQALTLQHFRGDGSSPFQWDPHYARVLAATPGTSIVDACSDGVGGAYLSWFERDTLADSLTVRLIRVRPTSVPSPGWSPKGTVVDRLAYEGSIDYLPPRVTSDGQQGVIVAWAHGSRGVRAQRFFGDSLPRWGAGGRTLDPVRSDGVRIVKSESESWFAVWRAGLQVRVLRIDGDGDAAPSWTGPLELAGGGWDGIDVPSIESDGIGGVYLAHISGWYDLPPARSARMHRITGTGEPAAGWGPVGLVVQGVISPQGLPQVAASPSAILMTWVQSTYGEAGPVMGVLVSSDGVAINPNTRLPLPLAVVAAGPNPMRDAFTLRLRSGQSQRLDADVLDLSGRRVRVLERGLDLPPGDHPLQWDGRDALGARVRPGVYLVRVRSTAGTVSTRVVAGL